MMRNRVVLGAALVIAAGTVRGLGAAAAAHAMDVRGAGIGQVERDVRPEASRLKLVTERAAVFKDGYVLIVKNAAGVADSRGRVFTDEVPDAAVLGCFWAASTGAAGGGGAGGDIVAMRAELVKEEREESDDQVCLTLTDVLRANAETTVTVTMRDESQGSVYGKIVRVLETAPAAPLPTDPIARGASVSGVGETRTELVSRGGAFVVMETGGSNVVVPIGDIRTITGDKLTTTTTRTERVTHISKRLGFELGAGAAGKPVSLRIMYFTPGIRWIPTYRLMVNADNKSGVLALQGELLNECEDLRGVALDLVVGVPNFRFRGTVSPLVMERTLRNALLGAAPDLMGRQGQLSNAFFAQRASERSDDGSGGIVGAEVPAELSAGGDQDLFVYSFPSFELARGDRASVPVLKQGVEFEHLYTLDIAAVRDPRQMGTAQYASKSPGGFGAPPPGGESPGSRFSVNQVWHQIELKNASSAPWTTGAALVMGAERAVPIAQELLRYTPAGGKVLMPLTVAVDVRAELVEEELSREDNVLKRNGTSYTLVKARSTITLTSSRREASTTRVTLALGGRVAATTEGGQVKLSGHTSADWGNNDPGPVNNHSDVTWQVELKAGETKTLAVEFSYYTY